MTDFYRTTYTVSVLSEGPIPGDADFEGVLRECSEGEFVASIDISAVAILTGKEMADALSKAGSTPDFFRLADDGTLEED